MSGRRILVADRDEAIASLLRVTVSRELDCEVVLVREREEAVALLSRGNFDLVLLDIGLHSEGLETLRHVAGRNAGCEVIAMTTGVITARLLKTLADADVFAVVVKPFDLNQLAQLVSESLAEDRIETAHSPRVFGTVQTRDESSGPE